LVVIFSKSK